MSDISANLALPYLAPSQAQKHVTHNEALQILDAVVQLAVLSRDRTDPPADPEPGARYIVADAATGAWAGQDGQVALWTGNAWLFVTPHVGWQAWVAAEARAVVRHDGQWQAAQVLDNLKGVGINTTADDTNRLSVSAAATLLGHEGAGHQLKINKAQPGDTGSLLFQTGFSGRAEMGLAGSDAWSIKVSDDGATWTEALSLDPSTGLAGGAMVQADPGDTTPGRLMKSGAFGLGGDGIAVDAAALDAIAAPGFYRLTGALAGVLDAGACVLHMQPDAAGGVQIGFQAGSDVVHWRRRANGSWQGWQEFLSRASLLGPVSQAAGLATGAVIERGSNGNGDYVRFADGTQICTSGNFAADATSPAGALYRWANTKLWTFPAGFAGVPSVSASNTNNATLCWGTASQPTTSEVSIGLFSILSVPGRSASFTAVGRWF